MEKCSSADNAIYNTNKRMKRMILWGEKQKIFKYIELYDNKYMNNEQKKYYNVKSKINIFDNVYLIK
ncbi:hypothetical protein FEF22_002065 [Texas Phoenix palm phytoplasma]|uniref:Uncharacterized protein n=1 Tax=Texas Phoenix palm phytoplasma TaxID=176709 RepID=A0ABS5BIY9_9MOLU|nr:hypothetical protein [Texas Phoenix palm phytoplasma]MBP3059553.1 hypothetical protein [Texas Phoenix palm phytoplasma]